jgi:hypothetical protein
MSVTPVIHDHPTAIPAWHYRGATLALIGAAYAGSVVLAPDHELEDGEKAVMHGYLRPTPIKVQDGEPPLWLRELALVAREFGRLPDFERVEPQYPALRQEYLDRVRKAVKKDIAAGRELCLDGAPPVVKEIVGQERAGVAGSSGNPDVTRQTEPQSTEGGES